ncbi:fez family zinc finger protein 1-like [Anneissia japonica]|uniref:fez family zinc finger protein 1-like n=1 Tax=Anneissia japonica TaxID=1529436 RepID=UPI001425B004|nr:fez family zinc finger protein 1-like [Anneissia japonica]XP_033104307.1 fez family zinc finger protein 1-like [Anneissia japonica]
METIKEEENVKQKETGSRKSFRCEQCDKVFKKQYLLKRHSVVHTGERKFVCSICDKTFKLRSTLDHHYAVHSKEKLFACSLCPQQFSRMSTLRTHMAIHAKMKNFQCDICGKDFVQKGNLTSHMNTHSNKRPFKCTICGWGYNQGSNLKKHIITTHTKKEGCAQSMKSPNKNNPAKMQKVKVQESLESSSDTHENGLYRLILPNDLESITAGCSQSLENSHQTGEPEVGPQIPDQNSLPSQRMLSMQNYERVLDIDKEPQSSSLRLLQSNITPGVLILVDDKTGEISLPVMQESPDNQVLRLLIDTCDVDSMSEARQQMSSDFASTSGISSLCMEDILSERFDQRPIQNELSIMFGRDEGLEHSVLEQESLEDTMNYITDSSMDLCIE